MPTEKLTKLLLLDVFHLAFVMLALGLLVYSLIRRSNPLIRWHENGNVWTEPFLKVDLLVMMVVIGSYYAMVYAGAHSEKPAGALNSDNIVPSLLVSIVMTGMLLSAVLFVILYLRRVDPVELFGLRRLRPREIVIWTIGAMFLAYPAALIIGSAWINLLEHALGKAPASQEMVTMMKESTDLPAKMLMAFSAIIVAPIAEEILFRGYFYPAVKRFSERYFAAIVISLLFAVVHNNTMSVVPLFILAMGFTIAYELTGCLLVPILMHALFNASQVILIFAT